MAQNAKIFRINYKSDFILTLESDAGWMTPFCIKFWTGAPSQAFFAQWDGTTYTHCAYDPSEPTKLTVQFDDHHLPIGDLKFQIGYHFTVSDFPTSVEDEVLNQASVIIEVDGAPAQVMLDFNGETAPEIEFSLPAYANEAQRIANEEQRIAAEQQRIANEDARIQDEEIRQQNEQQRIDHETARINEFATLKSQSQAATRDANDAATLANQKAQLAADKAALADGAATLAIQKAQLAADKAALANDAAQLAADKAALAQQKAEYAQQQGSYAKDQGDYAKNQGNYAKEQGDTALADHQRAEADHGIAVDDHTQAGNDHTRAESDHSIAVDDHTQAGNDHTRAESDHGIAVDDHTQAGNDHTRAESDHNRAESDHAAVEVFVDSLGAFDISAYHATGGVLAKYADLTAALGTNGANIPEALRKGGMSVKFVQSSAHKYVQYRLMATSFSTTETDWQGVDDEPTAGSENLVKSGGVQKDVENIVGIDEDLVPTWVQGKRLSKDGRVIDSGNAFFVSDYIEVTQEVQTNIKGIRSYTDVSMPCVVFFSGKSQSSNLGYKYVGTGASKGDVDITEEIETLNAKYIRLSHYSINDDVANVRLSIFKQSMFTTHEEVDNSISDAISLVKQVSVEKNTQFPNLLYGHTEYVNNKYLANGKPADNQNWCSLLSYVPVDEGETYAINRPYKQGNSYLQYLVCFYDTSKAYLSSVNTTMNSYFSVPSGAAYIRMSITNTHYSADGEDNFDNIFLQKVANGYQVRTIDASSIIINGFPKTTLFGKNWALFGDSITEKNFRSNINYHDYIRCETNIITSNFGIGGSGYKNLDDGGSAIYQRLYALREELSDYDIITIMAGVNDCTRGSFNSDIGNISDVFTGDNYSSVTNNSIFACFKKSIELVFEYAPLTHIAIISPLPAVTSGLTFNPSDNTNRMSVFVNGCKELCAMYGIPYLDMYHQSGLRPWDDTVNQQLFKCISSDSPDRLHPNEYGHKWIYPMIRDFIKKLL